MSINRRNFIKAGGLAMIGSIITPQSLMAGCTAKTTNGTSALKNAMDFFGVTENQLQKILATALEKGGNYADLFFEHSLSNSISLMDGAVNRTYSNIDFGMGVRVVAGDHTGYAYVENISLDDMLNAARTAARIANDKGSNAPINLSETKISKQYYNIKTAWSEMTVKDKMPYLQKLNDKMFAADNRIIKVAASLGDTTSHIFFCNSLGQMYSDYRPMVTLGVQCIMQENDKIESNFSSRAYRMGAEFLTDDLIDTLVKEAVEKTSILFESIKPVGGEMPVVMGAGGSGILLHEAIGHAFEADFNRKNISIFSDKLNKKICDENINIVDDGTIANNRGAVNIDDEGVEGQKTYIVKDGVLSSYLHDRISAKHYGIESTGNGRRESFRCMPIPRMRSTYMESGNYDEKELIAAVKKGVYVSNFTNGQVQIGAGDFTFYVKNGYLIENGKLTQPIKDINIIGNGPKALADITMVASNLKMDDGTWTCGKDGQSMPVTLGMPSALVSKLTVGGEN